MNDKISSILEKYGLDSIPLLHNAIIEICEEQKNRCYDEWMCEPINSRNPAEVIKNSKNIADCQIL